MTLKEGIMAENYRQEEVVKVVRNLIKSDGLVDIDLHVDNHRITAKVHHLDDVYEIEIEEIGECLDKSIPPRYLSVTRNGELMYNETLEFNLGVSLYNDAFKVWKDAAPMLIKCLQSDIEESFIKKQKIDAFLANLS